MVAKKKILTWREQNDPPQIWQINQERERERERGGGGGGWGYGGYMGIWGEAWWLNFSI